MVQPPSENGDDCGDSQRTAMTTATGTSDFLSKVSAWSLFREGPPEDAGRVGPNATTVSASATQSVVSGVTTTTATVTATTTVDATMPPTPTIVVAHAEKGKGPSPPEDFHRAVHRIRVSALQHNFHCVESAANRQRCSVIVVVKADGYGHGAIATALHLADFCGADAFAVATLEEGIALRKAFENNPPGRWNKTLAAMFHTADPMYSTVTGGASTTDGTHATQTVPGITTSRESSVASSITARVMRPSRIRILVLGPPVGFPRCFDDYYHHDIEVMVSGPEVAAGLIEWVADEKERKRTQVERVAAQTKAEALVAGPVSRDSFDKDGGERRKDNATTGGASKVPDNVSVNGKKAVKLAHASSTLGTVQGRDLANEVRTILMNQNKAVTGAALAATQVPPTPPATASAVSSGRNSCASSIGSGSDQPVSKSSSPAPAPTSTPKSAQVFGGIEAAAKTSRQRAIAAERANEVVVEDSSESDSTSRGTSNHGPLPMNMPARKRLRWHALVDSGMGRLGFRTEVVKPGEDRKDTVAIMKELVDTEILNGGPIEFMGMCTHMADANSTSTYSHDQIAKFINLLKRVREAKIFIPTVSTDNSAALLTTNLTHFNPKEILSQSHADTRGYVRTGGAIYGQRPAFKQLRAVSTLLASVRHVAILKKGETVGYDRAYTAPYDVRIATLTIGFADGYPRELGNGVGKVAIRGSVFSTAGNICMDMMMVELGPASDKTGAGAKIAVRDTAVLWGPLDEEEDEGLVRLKDLAETLKTTQSALTCGLDKIRVRRQFV